MPSSSRPSNSLLATLAILSIFVIAPSTSIMSPALKTFSTVFPEISRVNITMLQSITSLCILPTALLSSWLVSTRFRYRPLLIFGCIAYLIAGVLPFWFNNFWAILLDRAVFGLAFGITLPLGNALILRLYSGERCATLLGRGASVSMAMAIVLQMGAGALAAISWNYVFLAHLIGVISLVMIIIGCPEPEKIVRQARARNEEERTARRANGEKIPVISIWYYFVYWAAMILVGVLLMMMSFIVSSKGLGGSFLAGFMSSILTLGGFLSGLLVGKMTRWFSRFLLGVALIIAGAGMAIILLSPNIVGLAIGAFITGIGFVAAQPGFTYELGLIMPKSFVSTAAGIQQAMKFLASFLSSYFIGLVSFLAADQDPMVPVTWSMIGLFVVGAAYIVSRLKPTPSRSISSDDSAATDTAG